MVKQPAADQAPMGPISAMVRKGNPLWRAASLLKALASAPGVAEGLALVGGLVYLAHSGTQIQSQASVLDEGLYLYKGYLFSSGRYWPYQDFGDWTNHMPLSFLIPGWVQLAFGLGIRTGRYYAVVLGLVMLAGLWITTRRFGDRWWAAGAVWLVALNPALVRIYSQAVSQVLIAAMLAWVLVLTLGKERPGWQTLLGSALAGAVLMTRINMLPLLPLLIGYLYWERGRRGAIMSAVAGLSVVVFLHAIYLPGILKLWAYWLPPTVTPFLNSWRDLSGSIPVWDPQIGLRARLISVQSASAVHMTSLLGVFFAWLSWPSRSTLASRGSVFRVGVFLSALFTSLFLLHVWAAIGQNYCVFCLRSYLAFFGQLGIILFVLSAKHWFGALSTRRKVISGLTFALLALATSIWSFDVSATHLLSLPVPRIAGGQLLPGTVETWVLIEGKLGISFARLKEGLQTALLAWTLISVSTVILLSLAMVYRRRRTALAVAPTALFWIVVGSQLLGSSMIRGSAPGIYDCNGDVIRSYEAVGDYLAARIPADAQIFWDGGLSPVPLLSLPQANIYPPQLNNGYSRRLGGEAEELLRFGYWNDALAREWLENADYVLVNRRGYAGWIKRALRPDLFDEIEPTPPTVPCRADSDILIFRRIR